MHKSQPQSHKNVMESLVAEEVKQQLRNYPPQLIAYLNTVEVETYALNRLPPLYASCEEGWRKQKQRAEHEFKSEIQKIVRQAFAAVRRDPIRFSTPLASESEKEYEKAREALKILQELLRPDDPSWNSLARTAKAVLSRASWNQMSKKNKIQLLSESTDRWTEYHQAYRY